MTSINLKLVSPFYSSTNLNTQVDICYSNLKNINVKYFENLFSYHKPMNIIIDVINI